MNLVQVVYVGSSLKVLALGTKKYVRFPKHLRKVGVVYEVDGLKNQGSFFTVEGNIRELVPSPTLLTSKGVVKPDEWHIVVEYAGIPDMAGNLDRLIYKAGKKLGLKDSGSGYCFMSGNRDVSMSFEGDQKSVNKVIAKLKPILKTMEHKPKVTMVSKVEY